MSEQIASERSTDFATLFALIFLLIGIGGIVRPRRVAPPVPDFSLSPSFPDLKVLQPIWRDERRLLDDYPTDTLHNKTVEAFLAFGSIEKETGGRVENPAYFKASERVINAMNHYWFARGEAAYRAMGVRMTDQFVRVVQNILARAVDAGLPVQEWVGLNAQSDQVKQLYSYTGNFLSNALSWGLISDNRLVGGNDALLRLHFKLRWFQFVTEIKDYTMTMALEELKAVWRWRIEGDRSLSMGQRVQFSRWLQNIDPEYPAFQRLGALYAQRGRYRHALAMYREALLDDPFNALLGRNLSFLLSHFVSAP
jgi:tetratricopeptide (TPR) repeat protein